MTASSHRHGNIGGKHNAVGSKLIVNLHERLDKLRAQ